MKDINHQDFSEDEATASDDDADIEYTRCLQQEVDGRREEVRLREEATALVLAEVAVMNADIEQMRKEGAADDLQWIEYVSCHPEMQVALYEAKKDAVWDVLSGRVTAAVADLTVRFLSSPKKMHCIVVNVNECKCCSLHFRPPSWKGSQWNVMRNITVVHLINSCQFVMFNSSLCQ
jgi:hypothetical protein